MNSRTGLVLMVLLGVLVLLCHAEAAENVFAVDHTTDLLVRIPSANQLSLAEAENIEMVGQIGGMIKGVAVQGNYGYIGVGPRLVIMDISEPSQIHDVGQSNVLTDTIRAVAVVGEYAMLLPDPLAYALLTFLHLRHLRKLAPTILLGLPMEYQWLRLCLYC